MMTWIGVIGGGLDPVSPTLIDCQANCRSSAMLYNKNSDFDRRLPLIGVGETGPQNSLKQHLALTTLTVGSLFGHV